ncbi:DUF6893 family small protein [Cupriavidus basilensis]
MMKFLKYLVLPAIVVALMANMKDLRRYIRIRNM